MKWFIAFIIFGAGVYYLVTQDKRELENKQRQETETQAIKTSEPEGLPNTPERLYVIKFSQETLNTLRSLTEDPTDKVRFASIELLWQLQDTESPKLIKKMLQDDPESSVKLSIIRMLANDKSKLSLALVTAAANDYDREIRLAVVESLAGFGSKEALPALTRFMKDYDEEIKEKAIKAVTSIRQQIESTKEYQLEERERKPVFAIK